MPGAHSKLDLAGEPINGKQKRFVQAHVDDDKVSPVIRQPIFLYILAE